MTAQTTIPTLHVGAPRTLGPLDVFPIWTDAPMPEGRRYDLPDDGEAVVSELETGPEVESLVLINPGDVPLLVLEGMTLDAGWQHRVLTRSLLAAAGSRTVVPVRCIEQSRWSGSRRQRFSKHEAPLSVRKAARLDDVDQMQVWSHVADYEARHGGTRTNSLSALLETTSAHWREDLRALRPLPAQRGVLLGVLGHPVMLEVVDHPATLEQRWDALIGGLAADAVDMPYVPTPVRRAQDFADRARGLGVEATTRAGEGFLLDGVDDDVVSLRGIADGSGLLHANALNLRHELTLAV